MLMKVLKLLFLTILTSTMFTSCMVTNNEVVDNSISLEELVSQYDLWYVDYHKTEGNNNIPFISRAFTLSFLNGTMYANNNIVDIGKTGNGLGIRAGNYDTRRGVLEVNHIKNGYYNFDIVQISSNEIRLDYNGVSYYLVGYQRNDFDYDKLFYDNIEYFLQEYIAWERAELKDGQQNVFDEERFLQFTPKNTTTFYSSKSAFGTNVANINWEFIGSYTVYNISGTNTLKGLTLNYENGDTETFELSVINDEAIRLYHQRSQTTYTFVGKGFVQYLKGGTQTKKPTVRNSNRERTKIKRQTVDRKFLK